MKNKKYEQDPEGLVIIPYTPEAVYNRHNCSIPLTEEEMKMLRERALETEKFYKKKFNIKD